MRIVPYLALSTAVFSTACCVNKSREEPKASVPASESRRTAPAPRIVIELIQTSSCSAATDHQGPVGCRTEQSALADLDHDGQRDCILWNRCGPGEPSPAADGGIRYPHDVVTAVRADGAQAWTLYTNEQVLEAERFDDMRVLRIGGTDERLLTRAVGYGTGNVQNWAIVDVFAGTPRRWTEPDLSKVARTLELDERLGKQYGRGIEVKEGHLLASWLVYRPGDANCCPSGGLIKVRLVPTAGGLQPERVWREPNPSRGD